MDINLDSLNKVHFIGIGGIGMSALAFSLLTLGKKVSGSDSKESKTTEKLRNAGASINIGHDSTNITEDTDIVVISTAISPENPELAYAREAGITVCHRADLLNIFLRSQTSIAVTGTHGKTSTSALMSQILLEAGLNPMALVGGHLIQFDSNVIQGTGDYLIAEVDESDQSIHKLSANFAIITNLETDHLDHYKDLDEIISVMKKFISNMPEDGKLIICKDSYGNNKLIEKCDKEIISYSIIDDSATFKAVDVSLSKSGSKFKVLHHGKAFGDFYIPISGLHYVSNALAVIATANLLGVDSEIIKQALSSYKGVKRRFEIIAEVNGTLIIDDYAHHPTEIKATLSSASLYKRPVTVVFQPHRYSRTKGLLDDFAKSFEMADRIIITDIYGAGEKAENFNISSEDLVRLIQEKSAGKDVRYISSMEEIAGYLNTNRLKEEIILTMGAGTITNLSVILSENFLLPEAC